MRSHWLYSPTWLSDSLTEVTFAAFGLAGLCLTRGWV
jgi:hypothetical protein